MFFCIDAKEPKDQVPKLLCYKLKPFKKFKTCAERHFVQQNKLLSGASDTKLFSLSLLFNLLNAKSLKVFMLC